MIGFRKHVAASSTICSVFLLCALLAVFPVAQSSSPGGGAGAGRAESSAASQVHPYAMYAGTASQEAPPAGTEVEDAKTPSSAPAAAPVTAPATTAPQMPAEPPQEPENTPQVPDEPKQSAVNPDRPAPTNFTATFDYDGTRDVVTSWTGRAFFYYVLRWSEDDFSSMLDIFERLADLDPTLEPLVDDLETQFTRLDQSGLTYEERNGILDDTEAAVDPLFYALVRTPGAEGFTDEIVALADAYDVLWFTTYNDGSTGDDTYYLYGVSAGYFNGDTSPLSNTDGVFTVAEDGGDPATPTGFTATAYDPGVALEWDRNTENDLAGYDVYVMQGGTPVKLNTSFITAGAEFFYEDIEDAGGTTYRVRAVDLWSRQSIPASAVSVLAPATVYGPDDPAWQYSGTWKREDYTAGDPGGTVLQVASYAGSTASVTFTGRRVRVYSARYWSCGTVRYRVYDAYGSLEYEGTADLYYDGGYYTEEYGQGTYVPPLWQERTLQVTGLSKGQHTLVIEDAGIAGAGGDTFVNFDYAEVR